MFEINDQYSKVVEFGITGSPSVGVPNMTNSSDNTISNYWFSHNTIKSKTEPKAVLVVNTAATGISFNAYSYGSRMDGVTNYFRFSENIQGGLTATSVFNVNRWYNYSSSHPSGTSRFSPIRMPDGSTNGVRFRTSPPVGGLTAGGVYQPLGLQSPGVVTKGKVYTVSVWACGDSGGGVYPENPAFRISYYTHTPLSASYYSEQFTLTPTPTKYSFTFVSASDTSNNDENIAFTVGYMQPASQIVLWGAQICDGNTANNYIPTSTEWNGVVAPIGAGSISGPLYGTASPDSYDIDGTSVSVGGQSSTLLNIAPFAISMNTNTGYTRPTTISVYGLY